MPIQKVISDPIPIQCLDQRPASPDTQAGYLKIGAASILGGTLLGLTGGLIAAPFLAVSAGALVGSAWLTTTLGTAAGAGAVGSAFALTGAALTGYKMNKRAGDINEFSFQKLKTMGSGKRSFLRGQRSLKVTLSISGWISKDCDFATPWTDLRLTAEAYTLRWEGKFLKDFGQGVGYVANWATGQIAQEVLKETALAGVLSAIAWPLTLLSLGRVIDNPWAVAFTRSKPVGRELANVLADRIAGNRPVNLIAFGLGCRVIYHAINNLAKVPNESNRGIIQDVILMGAPIPANDDKLYTSWMESIVAGKLINCFCQKDWILKFLYRTASAQNKIAGLEPIKRVNPRIYNINLSDIVEGHNDYIRKMPMILKTLGYNASNFEEINE
ncbi:uncharacterized membrane protein F35D11.3-like isoform X2 [Gordionus sp. m RMFG-2023]|uniref:uncharacterized membrane protein F35D11.3-like isoform X2 n=1 Tax=Gordionus sp. m RMFG-2023 TaxID=3053472 RepID=UPI0031FD1427